MNFVTTSSPVFTQERRSNNSPTLDALARSVCRYCTCKLPAPFLELGSMPPANSFTADVVTPEQEFTCPLSVTYCPQCHLVQLTHVVPAEMMFSHYLYVSSTSNSFQRHFQVYSDEICGWFKESAIGLAVDIGSNDGALVKSFMQRGVPAIGVDPAKNLSDEANNRGLPTINRFFDKECVDAILDQYGPAGVVTANNVFAHVDDIPTLCKNVSRLLREDGLFIIEFPYLATMCKNMLFDMIYHEHLSYLSVSAVQYILNKHEFEIIAIDEVDTHGGSLRLIAQNAGGPRKSNGALQRYLTTEKQQGYQDLHLYEEFSVRVHRVKSRLRAAVAHHRTQGRTIAGYGAPAKANTLINFCKWSREEFAYIVDDNPLKRGLNAPGSGIPVLGPQQLIDDPPDTVMLFAWNFADEIIRKMQPLLGARVQWIIPLPGISTGQ